MNDEQRTHGSSSEAGARYPQVEQNLAPQGFGDAQMPSRPIENVARCIQIEPLNHGYTVTVNCQRFAVESKEALLHRLGLYLTDPGKVESEWMSGKLKW